MERGTKFVISLGVATALVVAGALYGALYLRGTERQLLVVRVIASVPIEASPADLMMDLDMDFGPLCAKARFVGSGALVVDSDALPLNATGVVYVEYRLSGMLEDRTGDHIDLRFFSAGLTGVGITSPLQSEPSDLPYFTIDAQTPNIVVTAYPGPRTYGVGETFYSLGRTVIYDYANGSVVTSERYEATNLGEIPVTVQPPPACP